MPTPPALAPVEEILAYANACAEWLVSDGSTTLTNNRATDPAEVLHHASKFVSESPNKRSPSTVFEILFWLWCCVLPQLDSRYRAHHDSSDPYNGAIEHNCARKVRDILATIGALKMPIREVAERQFHRCRFEGQTTSEDIQSAFEEWMAAGQRLRALIEPTGVAGISAMQVPHTLSEWQIRRLELELYLHLAYFTDREITQLLPGGGTARDVFRRRSHVRELQRQKGEVTVARRELQ